MIAVPAAIAAAFALCLAVPQVLVWLGCLDLGVLGMCAGVSAEATMQPVILVALFAAGAAFSGALGVELVRHLRLARALAQASRPAVVMGHTVGLVSGIEGATVAGLGRPAIYCSDDLLGRLDGDELEAVLLHEGHHQRTRAPLRLVVLAAAGHFVGWTAAGRSWLAQAQAAIEIAADDHVLSAGLPRTTLARAILKLFDAPAELGAAAFSTAADVRLRTLLGDQALTCGPRKKVLAIGLVVLLTVCGVMA